MASGKTLYAIHRRRGWPYSSVKQMAARVKECEMDVTFLAHSERTRLITKQDKDKNRDTGQRSAQDEHQASTTFVLGRDGRAREGGGRPKKTHKSQQHLPATKAPISCDISFLPAFMNSFPHDFKKINVRDVKDVAKYLSSKTLSIFTRPPFSQSLKQNSSPSTIKPNSCPFLNGPQNCGINKTASEKSHKYDIFGLTKHASTHLNLTIHRGKRRLEPIRPFNPKKNRNDTAYDGFGSYSLLAPGRK